MNDPYLELELPVAERAVIRMGNVWACVIHTDEGVIVDLYDEDGELLNTMAHEVERGED